MAYPGGDIALITHYVDMGRRRRAIRAKFSKEKEWSLNGVKSFVARGKQTGDVARKAGSGRPGVKVAVKRAIYAAVSRRGASGAGKPTVRKTRKRLAAHEGYRAVEICATSVFNAMRDARKPFKTAKTQRMNAGHMARRVTFCKQMLTLARSGRAKLDRSVCPDKKSFRTYAAHGHVVAANYSGATY